MSTTTQNRPIQVSKDNEGKPASPAQVELLTFFQLPSEGLTRKEASNTIERFFGDNPDQKAVWQARKADQAAAKQSAPAEPSANVAAAQPAADEGAEAERETPFLDRYMAASAQKVAGSDKEAATRGQIREIMRLAHLNHGPDESENGRGRWNDRTREAKWRRVFSELNAGMTKGYAHTLIRRLNGSFVERAEPAGV